MAETAGSSAGSALAAAEARIRDTAKWLTVSVASIATLLAAGTQLSSLGKLASNGGRMHTAMLAGGVTLAMVAIILGASVWVAATPAHSLKELVADPPMGLGDALTAPDYMDGVETVGSLNIAFNDAVTERRAAYSDALQTPYTREKNDRLTAADGKVIYLSGVIQNLIGVVRYRNLAFRWRLAGWTVVVAGAVAAAGLGVFAWAVNPPDDVTATNATAAVLTTAKPGTATLTATGADALSGKLGADCSYSSGLHVLVVGKTDAGADVVVNQSGCAALRFIAVPDWASIAQ